MRRLCSLLSLSPSRPLLRAADRPVAGDRLSLKDPRREARTAAASGSRRRRDLAVDPDERRRSARRRGDARGDGREPGRRQHRADHAAAGAVDGARQPAGQQGLRFKDSLRTDGIKTVILKSGNNGGTLVDRPAARATGPTRSRSRRERSTCGSRWAPTSTARASRPSTRTRPARCGRSSRRRRPTARRPPGPVCGNGVAEGTEECDDGGTSERRRLLVDVPARGRVGALRRRADRSPAPRSTRVLVAGGLTGRST